MQDEKMQRAPAVAGEGSHPRREVLGQPPILNTFVPHTGHTPESAGLPFFIVICCGFLTSRFALHLTQ